jgi:outer membrane protein assembly factor BamA
VRRSILAVAGAALAAVAGRADAQPTAVTSDGVGDPEASAGDAAQADPTFGPVIEIEDIVVVGNHATAAGVVERALPFARGDVIRAGDPRLARARWKLLALGFFRDVDVALAKGSARGRVIVRVTVAERGTIALNRLWFGTSALAPWWLGADLSERNLLGTGLHVGGALAYVDAGAVAGGRAQWSGELRLADPALGRSRWGLHGAISAHRGSEPYRATGPAGTSAPEDLRAFTYARVGGRLGATWAATPLTALSADLRVEAIDAAPPTDPVRTYPDGTRRVLDLGLVPGASRVTTVALSMVHDARPDPALPHEGQRAEVLFELGAAPGDYDFAALLARYDRFWPLTSRHALGLRAAGGVVLGDAPRFDRIHLGDVNRMMSPRVLGMTTALAAPPDLLGTANAEAVYGQYGGNLVAEYVYRWWRGPDRIYGGDLFIAVGAWGLRSDDAQPGAGPPIDLVVDVGLRVDTELGVFEFSLANALGRVPRW